MEKIVPQVIDEHGNVVVEGNPGNTQDVHAAGLRQEVQILEQQRKAKEERKKHLQELTGIK